MILIIDIGKTNKKCFVFDENYRIIYETSDVLPVSVDEDGFPCEDLHLLKKWVIDQVSEVLENPAWQIKAINCTAYGASFVHLNAQGAPVAPLYNYLKPLPEPVRQQFIARHGSESEISLQTASPALGMLNSGLQLFWLKYAQPEVYRQISTTLHLPQYIAYILGRDCVNEMTSIGCHTFLWDFSKNDYHHWVKSEKIDLLFPPIGPSTVSQRVRPPGHNGLKSDPIAVGTGLHDSSAALIPYLANFEEPFVLISTGTWCISMNPFNDAPLTAAELAQDCLCYQSFTGKPVKAARYFGGHLHDEWVKKTADAHRLPADFYNDLARVPAAVQEAYRAFMAEFVQQQAQSTRLAIGDTAVRRIFVDGGFSKNELYLTLLAAAFPGLAVFAAEVAQATALGAALAMHTDWNPQGMNEGLVGLRRVGF